MSNSEAKLEIIESMVPVKKYALFVKFYKPSKLISKKVILILHWMDSRGMSGNDIYHKICNYFALLGYPVFIFDQSGSGKSTGEFQYPKKQSKQVIAIYDFIKKEMKQNFNTNEIDLLPIVHSIAGVTIMHSFNLGLPFKTLIWLGGPPSHGISVRKGMKHSGISLFKFRALGMLDRFTGIFGKPIYQKMFGFRLRVKDMQEILYCHGADMMKKQTNLRILGIFGTNDKYMTLNDLHDILPEGNYPHFKRIIVEGASHGFQEHVDILIKYIQEFIKN